VFEKITQNAAQSIFCQNLYANFTVLKSNYVAQSLGDLSNYQKSKQLSNSLKFAQSGHPAVTITSHERDSFQ
jgi:hypothetical protein